MIETDVHQQFASYFTTGSLQPYIYLLSKKLSEGHICIFLEDNHRQEMLAAGYEHISPWQTIKKDPLVAEGITTRPFVLLDNRLYLQRYFNYETVIIERIKALLEEEAEDLSSRTEALLQNQSLIKSIFDKAKDQVTNWPLAAAVSAALQNFTIITGGPGTGKTTTVAKILAILFTINPELTVSLTAPTGKAAARMAESLKIAGAKESGAIKEKFDALEPATIHRILGYIPRSPYFKHNKSNPLKTDLLIVDESSMIDAALFAKLLDAIGPGTKLILLGDKDQLASVEAGSLFGDLCQAQPINQFSAERTSLINSFITEPLQQLPAAGNNNTQHPLFQHVIGLQKSYRFSDDKGIGKFSKAIIQNQPIILSEFFSGRDEQVTLDDSYSETLFQDFISGYEAYIKETDIALGIRKFNELRVLCAVRSGEQGLYALNKKIEQFLQAKKWIRFTGEFYQHRPIMVTSNHYELQLFNGDTGIIREDENGQLKAWFETTEGGVRAVSPGYISQCETTFAMTIHKSQGSEFEQLLVVLPKSEKMGLLTRELLYTAVTRAKSKLIVQGKEELLIKMAATTVQRGSGIINRFNKI
ncbi:MAG: recD [Ferruginibacter sp.]|nr:recD [Ferruginibacter sp.]